MKFFLIFLKYSFLIMGTSGCIVAVIVNFIKEEDEKYAKIRKVQHCLTIITIVLLWMIGITLVKFF